MVSILRQQDQYFFQKIRGKFGTHRPELLEAGQREENNLF